MNINKTKRERSINFNLEERDILISLVCKYQDTLENKQSGATTWEKKNLVWKKLEKEFNARSGGAYRTSKTLKIKYEGLKRSLRKKSAAMRSELYHTGGGNNIAPVLDSTEEKIKSLITLSADGLQSVYDSDVILSQTQDSIGYAPIEEFLEIVETPIENESIPNENIDICKNLKPDEGEVTSRISPSPSEEIKEEKDNDNINGKDEDNTSSKKKDLIPSSNLKWDNASRKNLKSRRHRAFVADFQKKPTKIKELAQAKLQFVAIQTQLLKEEMVEKRKEFEFKEKQRQWMEEEHKLKIQILQKELNK